MRLAAKMVFFVVENSRRRRRRRTEEEGLLCIVKVRSEYEGEEEWSLHFFFSSGRELLSEWENLLD